MNLRILPFTHLPDSVRRVLLMVLVAMTVAMSASAVGEQQTDVRIVSDGTNFVAIWRQGVGRGKLVLSRVNRSGVMLDETPVVVASDPFDFDIVFGGSTYLILWTDGITLALNARRLSVGGSFLDDQPIALAAGVFTVSAVWDGNRFFVVWPASERGVGGMFGAFLDSNGVMTDAKPLSPAERYFDGGKPHVAWNGQVFLISWSTPFNCDPACYGDGDNGVRLVHVSREGDALDAKAPFFLPDAARTRFASDGVSFLGFFDQISGGISTFSARVDGEVQVGNFRKIFSWFSVTASELAWDGTGYVLASRYSQALGGYPPSRQPWLSLTRLFADGTVRSRLVMELPDLGRSAPQVAVNAAGDTVMAIAEVSSEGISRIRIHVPEEMHASPLPPDPPTVTTAVKSSATTRVTWTDNASNVDGYVIEEAAHSYYRPYDRALIVVDRAARSAEAPTWRAPLLIRSFNAGGMSAAAPITPAAVRQRAVGPR